MKLAPENILFISVSAGALLLTRIPYAGPFFRVINTMVHESAHALMALLSSGQVQHIELFHDTSGLAVTKLKNRFSGILVSLAGYVAASATASLLFYLLTLGREQWILYLLCGLCALNLLFWVRNLYGILYVIALGAACACAAWYAVPLLSKCLAVLLASLLLSESVFSTWTVFYLSISRPRESGDAYQLQQLTYIPAFFWGLFFFLQSLFFLYLVIALFFDIPFFLS